MLRFIVMCLGAFLIGLSKAGFGGGTGMIVAPLLALVMPPKLGLGLMLPLLLATDVMALAYYRGQWDRRSVVVLLPPALLGIGLGGYLLRLIPGDLLARLIGLLALGFGGMHLWQARRPLRPAKVRFRPWLGAALGFVAGVTSTLAHLGGLLTAMYLLPQQLGPACFVGTSTAIFICMNAAKLPAYYGQGLLPQAIWQQAASLFPALAAGVALGFVLNGRVTPKRFSAVVIGIVFVTGLYLILRPSSAPTPASRDQMPLMRSAL
jgi:uncharacterized membrane protein YfcA